MSTNDPSWPSDGGSATPPPPPPGGGGTQGASLGVRFGARLIDGILLAVVNFILLFVIPGDSIIVSGIVGALLALGYYAYLESSSGATLGKKALGLQVIGAGGGNPTMEEALKRNVWLGFQIVPFIGGLAGFAAAIAIAVTISTSDDNRGLHDNFANTTVRKN